MGPGTFPGMPCAGRPASRDRAFAMTDPDSQDEAPAGPALKGIRVVELGTFISAPFAASLLADFGAEVIKIELPEVGDPMRTLGSHRADGSGYWWSSLARNKRSVALDIRTPDGRDILGRLLQTTDILIENFRPGTLDRWGITRAWLDEQRPGIVVVRISGYGQDGPWRDLPGFDRSAQAFSGLVYATGERDAGPQQAGLPVCDYVSGLWAAFGAVTAVLGKLNRDAAGNEVEILTSISLRELAVVLRQAASSSGAFSLNDASCTASARWNAGLASPRAT